MAISSPFLPCILKRMPRNCNLRCFNKSKCHQNEEDQQFDQNLNNSKSGQDTSACKIFRPFLPAFQRKSLETSNLTNFPLSKWHLNEENQQTMTNILSVMKVVRIHQHTKFQAIPLLHSHENAQKSLSEIFLEQLEYSHSENTSCCPMITLTIDSYWISSRKKIKSKSNFNNAESSNLDILKKKPLHVIHPEKLLDMMYKHESLKIHDSVHRQMNR